jgi:uncharacterized membrane protein
MSNQPPYGYSSPPAGKTKVMNLDYNVAALLCYLPICCINLVLAIILLASEPKENRFVRFHALQSLLLMGIAFVVCIVFWILAIAIVVTPVPGRAAGWGLLGLIEWVFGIAFLALSIFGGVKAYQGQMWKLPVIGDIAEKNI